MATPQFAVRSQFWLMVDDESLAGRGRIELLLMIQETGSIRQAAMRMGMSYRAAWDAVDAMNRRIGCDVVTRCTGGARGGGAQLTDCARRLIDAYRRLDAEHRRHLERMSRKLAGLMAEAGSPVAAGAGPVAPSRQRTQGTRRKAAATA